jgi:hypothetical protein
MRGILSYVKENGGRLRRLWPLLMAGPIVALGLWLGLLDAALSLVDRWPDRGSTQTESGGPTTSETKLEPPSIRGTKSLNDELLERDLEIRADGANFKTRTRNVADRINQYQTAPLVNVCVQATSLRLAEDVAAALEGHGIETDRISWNGGYPTGIGRDVEITVFIPGRLDPCAEGD